MNKIYIIIKHFPITFERNPQFLSVPLVSSQKTGLSNRATGPGGPGLGLGLGLGLEVLPNFDLLRQRQRPRRRPRLRLRRWRRCLLPAAFCRPARCPRDNEGHTTRQRLLPAMSTVDFRPSTSSCLSPLSPAQSRPGKLEDPVKDTFLLLAGPDSCQGPDSK